MASAQVRDVLDGIDLRWSRGVLCLRGENGSGKTTLLRVLAGLLPWDDGAVHLAGASLRDDRARALRAVGFVPERSDVPGSLTPREVAALVAAMRDVAAPDDDTARSYGLDGIYDVRRDVLDQRKEPSSDNPALLLPRRIDPGPMFPWTDVVPGSGLQRWSAGKVD